MKGSSSSIIDEESENNEYRCDEEEKSPKYPNAKDTI